MSQVQVMKAKAVTLAFKTAAVALLATGISVAATAGDVEAGKAKAVMCAACHGPAGISPSPIWPNLAGQKEAYLVKQLKDFKSGARKDPTMSAMAMSLSDADVENVAAYFASLK